MAVEATERCRTSIQLPAEVVVLNDWGDAGIVWLDYAALNEELEPKVFWASTHNFIRRARCEPMDSDVDSYLGYEEWAVDRADDLSEDDSA